MIHHPIPDTAPRVRALTEAEARAVLARGHVGRFAYVHDGEVDIEPITYSYDADWIFGRTSMGTKLSSLAHRPACAFETDEVTGPFAWSSVVVLGTFYVLDPEWGSPALYTRALQSVRSLVPEALGPQDPTPHRSLLFGVYVRSITGRECVPPAPAAVAVAASA